MSFLDYVPIAGPLSHGDYKGALYDVGTAGLYTPLSQGYNNLIKKPYQQYQQGIDQATQQLRTDQSQMADQLAQNKLTALSYYAPLQRMFNQAYGTGGLQAARTPAVPGSGPLSAAFGGGRGGGA
jgi:ABC-type transport system substrate-binding protein